MLEELLRHILEQARLGPASRSSLQRAIASRSERRMRESGRKAVQALARQGDLIKVMIQSGGAEDRPYHALRGRTGLIDLSPLQDVPEHHHETEPSDPPSQPLASPNPAVAPPADEHDGGMVAQERLLHAMEAAQSLQVSMGGGYGAGAWLDPVLEMLDGYLADVAVYAELHSPHTPPEGAKRLFVVSPDDRPFWASTRVSGEMMAIPDLSVLPPPLYEMAGIVRGVGRGEGEFHDAAAVPIFAPSLDDANGEDQGREEIGLLFVLTRQAMGRDRLMQLGVRLSRFVTHSWHQRQLMNRLVHTDQLTGVRNRGYFDSQFALEVERSKRQDSTLVLLLGDIDHFKHVNDTYGHQMGDRVLKTVARELLQGLRRIDLVCRVGGEEFALVLPDTSLEAARDVVTRIQVRIANLRLTDPDHPDPIRTTISFGGVAFPEGGEDPDLLYRLADQMLYLSKQRGRNRCHFWRADGEPLLTLPHYEAS